MATGAAGLSMRFVQDAGHAGAWSVAARNDGPATFRDLTFCIAEGGRYMPGDLGSTVMWKHRLDLLAPTEEYRFGSFRFSPGLEYADLPLSVSLRCGGRTLLTLDVATDDFERLGSLRAAEAAPGEGTREAGGPIDFLEHMSNLHRKAVGHAPPGADARGRAGGSAERHSSHHRRIVLVASVLGVLGAVSGIILSAVRAPGAKPGEGATVVLFAPFAFGAAGWLFGAAVACFFAPHDFFTGPLVEKWMNRIGTRRVRVARMVCLIFGLIVMAPPVGFGLFELWRALAR